MKTINVWIWILPEADSKQKVQVKMVYLSEPGNFSKRAGN